MTKDLKWYLNLVNKARAGFERIHFNFENFTVGKMLSNHTACYTEIACEKEWIDSANIIAVSF